MKLFDKLDSYQLLSLFENNDKLLTTTRERRWLAAMLKRPEAEQALSAETRAKLEALLVEEAAHPIDHEEALIQKGGSTSDYYYHPLIKPLREAIRESRTLELTLAGRSGQPNQQLAFPYKLEYSMVKHIWYLLWLHPAQRRVFHTKLSSIQQINLGEAPSLAEQQRYTQLIERKLQLQQTTVTVQIMPEYRSELARILAALSCFEKNVDYNEEQDVYTVHLHVSHGEVDYVLSKIRFLGRRVCIIAPPQLRQRMAETVAKALARYGSATATGDALPQPLPLTIDHNHAASKQEQQGKAESAASGQE